ncbi:MAG TPA: glycosyltransferase [Pyrinomonadaceae bacterium]|nr:glycosyltransferase [Pyrinomonadaceae bacterium]
MSRILVSIVIPVRDEEATINELFESIARQSYKPDEVVIVDGGSNDGTVRIIEGLAGTQPFTVRLVRTDNATPGRGRNLGIEAAANEWIALTDAGIRLEDNWLELLVRASERADLVLGNYSPVTDTFFTKCAAFAYVPPTNGSGIRGRFIASSMIKKSVWKAVGGFPDLRAAEDLIFIEKVEKAGFRVVQAPDAKVHWQLRPDLTSTFRKFALYSKHNVLAGRQWDWHYGLLRQYLLLLPFLLLTIFHSYWWLAAVLVWLSLRSLKRVTGHINEFGATTVLNPIVLFCVGSLLLTIDAATFLGWVQARISGERYFDQNNR